jgi:hypothetical protein
MVEPRAVECEKPGYSNLDAEGHMMYDNVYFLTEDEAWKYLQTERKAHVNNESARVEHAVSQLNDAKEGLVRASLLLARFWAAKKRHEEKLKL